MNRIAWKTVCIIVLSAMAVAFFLHEVGNSDLFWHLKAGGILASSGDILGQDVFSYTREGAPWINLEWVVGLVFHAAYTAAGFEGLSVLSALLGLLIALPLFWGLRKTSGSSALALFMVFLAFFACADRFGQLRAEMFGYIFFTSTLLVLVWPAAVRRVWPLPVIMMLWANCHPSAIMGPFMAAAFLIFRSWNARLEEGDYKKLKIVLFLCFLAVLINPFTWEVYAFPFREMGQGFMMSTVSDWGGPDLFSRNVMLGAWMMIGFAACALCMSIVFKKKPPLALVVISASLLAVSLLVGRFMPFAIIAMTFVLADLMGGCENCTTSFRFRNSGSIIALFCIAASLLIVFAGPVLGFRKGVSLDLLVGRPAGLGLDTSEFPVKAVSAIRKSVVGGRPFNDMAWGGFLIWSLWPEERVFIDTRTAVYGDPFIKAYSDALFDEESFDRLWEKYRFNYVIYDVRQMAKPGGPLAFLATDPSWLEFMRTKNAVVYLKVKKTD